MDYSQIMVEGGSLNFKSAALNVDKETVEQTRLSSGISKPHPHDVLAGRGASINQHPGNQYFRSLVKHLKNEYVVTPKSEKPQFAKLVVKHIRALKPPGRFLRKVKNAKEWTAMDDKGALDKTRQALREDAAKFKLEIDAGLRTVDTVSFCQGSTHARSFFLFRSWYLFSFGFLTSPILLLRLNNLHLNLPTTSYHTLLYVPNQSSSCISMCAQVLPNRLMNKHLQLY